MKHAGNLCRTCRRLGISSPQSHSLIQVLAGIKVCTQHLADLKKVAPKLLNDHLRTCLVSARDRNDKSAIKTIQNILKTKSIRRCWQSIRLTINPNRGGAVARLKVPHESGDILYYARDGVERQAAEVMATRYKVTRGAQILQDMQLHNDFGFLANTGATDRVLNRTYDYPEDMDVYTKLLLQEG
jgi:hypothetical protein